MFIMVRKAYKEIYYSNDLKHPAIEEAVEDIVDTIQKSVGAVLAESAYSPVVREKPLQRESKNLKKGMDENYK